MSLSERLCARKVADCFVVPTSDVMNYSGVNIAGCNIPGDIYELAVSTLPRRRSSSLTDVIGNGSTMFSIFSPISQQMSSRTHGDIILGGPAGETE